MGLAKLDSELGIVENHAKTPYLGFHLLATFYDTCCEFFSSET